MYLFYRLGPKTHIKIMPCNFQPFLLNLSYTLLLIINVKIDEYSRNLHKNLHI